MLGTNGFHVKAEKERFIAVSSHCGQGPVSRKPRKFTGDKNLFVSSIGESLLTSLFTFLLISIRLT